MGRVWLLSFLIGVVVVSACVDESMALPGRGILVIGQNEHAFSVDAKRISYATPTQIANSDQTTSETVEFVVRFDRGVPGSGNDFPYLQVGEALLTAQRADKPDEMLFVAFNPGELTDGSNVALRWGPEPGDSESFPTSFTYRAASLPIEQR